MVVTASGVPQIASGDVIAMIEGQAAVDYEKSLMEMFPWSTPQSGRVIADRYLLAGQESRVRVGVRKLNGSEEQIELERNQEFASIAPAQGLDTSLRTPALRAGLHRSDKTARGRCGSRIRLIDRSTGDYLRSARLGRQRVAKAVGGRLTDRMAAIGRIQQRVWHGPDPLAATVVDAAEYVYPAGKAVYRGAVAVLIDAGAFSAAEHTALFLEGATKVIFLGTPTAGTDGEVTGIVLPGGVAAHFAGLSVRHADGRPLQRVGILPDVWIEPTLAGIQQGRDEIVDRAVNVLLGTPDN